MSAQGSFREMDGDEVAASARAFVRSLGGTGAPSSRPSAPKVSPAVKDPPVEPSPSDPRDYSSTREVIVTPCGRRIVRETIDGYNRYRLFELVEDGATYSVSIKDRQGRAWGVAHTLRPLAPLTGYDAQVDHLLAQQRRAASLLRASVDELGLRDAHGRPAGVADALYESRGDLILLSDPAGTAARARGQRGGR